MSDLTTYVVVMTIPVYGLDLSCLYLWTAVLEGFWRILARGLDRNIRCGASTRDAERKRSEMLNRNRVSQVGYSFQILSESFLFRRRKVLLAFRLVFLERRPRARCHTVA